MPAPPPLPPGGLPKYPANKMSGQTNLVGSKANAPLDRSALLQQIQKGKSLKPVKTVQDRSAPLLLTNGSNNGNGRKALGQTTNLAIPTKEPATKIKNGSGNGKSPANSNGGSPAKSDDDQLCMRDLKCMLESKMRFSNTPSPAHSAGNLPVKGATVQTLRKSPGKITTSGDQLSRGVDDPTDHVTVSRSSADRGLDTARASKFATLGRRPTPQIRPEIPGGGAVPPPLPKKPPTLRRLAVRPPPPPLDGSIPGRGTNFVNFLPVSTSALSLAPNSPSLALSRFEPVPPSLPARNRSLINLCSRDCFDAPPPLFPQPVPPPPLDRSTKCNPGATLNHQHTPREYNDGIHGKNFSTPTVRPDLNRSQSITAIPVINHKPIPPTPSRRQPLPDFMSQSGPNFPVCNGPTKTVTPSGMTPSFNVQSLADEFERRFPFNHIQQFSQPHYYSDALKLYPSKSAANKQKQRSRPPPPPPAPRV